MLSPSKGRKRLVVSPPVTGFWVGTMQRYWSFGSDQDGPTGSATTPILVVNTICEAFFGYEEPANETGAVRVQSLMGALVPRI